MRRPRGSRPKWTSVKCGCGSAPSAWRDFLADSPFSTKRFAFFVGRRGRASTIQDVARETHLNWTIKALEMQSMREQRRRAGRPGPRAIGIDEISIRKGHTYRIVVSDLVRRRPIWRHRSLGGEHGPVLHGAGSPVERPDPAGGDGHGEAVRDLDAALDTVRKREYARVTGKDRRFIKGQKYTLLAHRENLTLEGRQALKLLLAANQRLHTASVLKESFGQLWAYQREGWARRFFDQWRAALKWGAPAPGVWPPRSGVSASQDPDVHAA